MIEYRVKFPILNVNFDKNELTFSINHIKSRRPSILYFQLHLYNSTLVDDVPTEIYFDGTDVVESTNGEVAYTSPRTVIGTAYSTEGRDYVQSFEINEALLEPTTYYCLELVTLGITSENPLYFAEPMFQVGSEYNGYHSPSELTSNHLIVNVCPV